MRKLFFAVLAFTFLQSCNQQKHIDKREIYYDDLKWKITVPENFENVSKQELAKMEEKGKQAVEKSSGIKIENNSKTIFIFRNGPTNYFQANWQPFDTAKDGSYLENCQSVNGILYNTLSAQMKDATIDTASTQEAIDGLMFQTFKMKISEKEKSIMDIWMFSRLFDKKEFTVVISAANETKRNALYDAFKHSTFGK